MTEKDINICHRVKGESKVECGGQIFVQTISDVNAEGKVIVTSKCGKCEATETDEYKIDTTKLKHSEQCRHAQAQKHKPTIYLQTVIPQVVVKCGGVLENLRTDKEYTVPCNAMYVEDGGFPF